MWDKNFTSINDIHLSSNSRWKDTFKEMARAPAKNKAGKKKKT
jgi:hypothetical protein